jgi:ADP-ribose pyrophosphatase YjhB (NUDIX family)
MFIKVYFGDKPVYLCDEIDKELNGILHHPETVFVDEITTPAIRSLLHEIRKPEIHTGVIWNKDLSRIKKALFKHFSVLEAAGGIVQNHDKEILFILRLGKWDLPKGKVEKGEKLSDCAKREVEEETGTKHITVKRKIGETYHTYDEFGKHLLKISHWYYMTCPSMQNPSPQKEENITQVKWFKTKDIKEPMKNTYPSVKDILKVFFDTP